MAAPKYIPRSTIDKQLAVAQPVDDDEPQEAPDERPQYRLTEQAYIEDRLLEIGATIRYDHQPGHHMVPINKAAKAVVAKLWPNGRPVYVDPIQSMAIVGKTEVTETAKLIAAMSAQTEAVTALLKR